MGSSDSRLLLSVREKFPILSPKQNHLNILGCQSKRPPGLMLMTLMGQELHWDVEPDLHMTAIKLRIYCLGTIKGFNNADGIYQSHNEEKMSFASSEKHIFQCCEQDCVNTAAT
ncbi:hypothetical protein TURU_121005 [Turdus rufiventris]|nr:hypothetical protein TURU_121005 [Turdus rufiventris]